MKKATIQLDTLTCPSCSLKIEKAVKGLDGVDKESVTVSFNTSKVKFNFDSEIIPMKDVEQAIFKLGYDVKKAQEREI